MNTSHTPQDSTGPPQERTEQFVQLYTEHFQRLQYFLMALLPNSNDAADVLQETSVVLWSKFHTFEIGTNFFAWACTIARLQSKKFYERGSHSPQLFDAETLDAIAADAIECASRPEPQMEVLESCLKSLSDSDCTLIRRRYEPGASVNQIAEEIGVSANMLSKTLGKIRRMLLACLERKLSHNT